jgi:hypothetical protein
MPTGAPRNGSARCPNSSTAGLAQDHDRVGTHYAVGAEREVAMFVRLERPGPSRSGT